MQKTKKQTSLLIILFFITAFFSKQISAQGTWTPLNNLAPDTNVGVMLLLSDGTVMAKTISCACDTIGNVWDKLTPDSTGSYINGTWSRLAPMHDTRLYFASQVLKDGRVFVAGGEYGSGGSAAETYNPLTDTWTMAPNSNNNFADANSEILNDGRVLVGSLFGGGNNTLIFNPVTNTWISGPVCHHSHDESAWVKLRDNSILFVDLKSITSERYIPASNSWVVDAHLPDSLYDPYSYETGAGFLLPDGRAFFLGATGHTAYYTPSGSTAAGSWIAGPEIPSINGTKYGTIDAAAAMMVNGKILCTASPVNTSTAAADEYQAPTAFFEFDYTTNSFTRIGSPDETDSLSSNITCFETNMLDLPDGTVLYVSQYTQQYYVYTPDGTPLVAGKPTINAVSQLNCDTFKITGTLFNGISEGAAYGDDWQMATNYPVIRLTNGTKVYYVRTFNWSSTNVQTGTTLDSTLFTLPAGLPHGTYSLVVTANGISSDSVLFVNGACTVGIKKNETITNNLSVYPNPTDELATVSFTSKDGGNYSLSVMDVFGRIIKQETGQSAVGDNTHSLNLNGVSNGVYIIVFQKGDELSKTRIIIK
ncbi:MAG TPA: T9SS type A sorting domain-containing protein [Bacteroidia bacterium]|nr:T9SS type A sorting domain-containing protein [Bacteroidia bacterium]